MNNVPVTITGHCLITDDLDRVHLNQLNSIHSENMSRVIARGLSHELNNSIFTIAFGTGGTEYTNSKITYNSVRDTGWNATLYNEVYNEPAKLGTAGDIISTDKTTSGCGTASLDKDRLSQVVITCTIGKNEPSVLTGLSSQVSQLPYDYAPTKFNELAKKYYIEGNNPFIFDEIGLFTDGLALNDINGYKDNPIDSTLEFRRMLTHLTFSPVMKTGNRIFNIKYTLTVFVNRTTVSPSLTIITPN